MGKQLEVITFAVDKIANELKMKTVKLQPVRPNEVVIWETYERCYRAPISGAHATCVLAHPDVRRLFPQNVVIVGNESTPLETFGNILANLVRGTAANISGIKNYDYSNYNLYVTYCLDQKAIQDSDESLKGVTVFGQFSVLIVPDDLRYF